MLTPTAKMIIGGITDFIITAGSSLTGYMVGNSAVVMPSTPMWILAIVLGLVGAAKHINGMLVDTKVLIVLPLLAALAGGGCAMGAAPLQKALTDLSAFTQQDLDAAIALANAATDAGAPYRWRCYTTLKKHVPDGSTVGQALPIKGVFSAFERAAELDVQARGGLAAMIPADVHADCAVLFINLQEFALRMGAKVAPVPGAGAIGGALR
jgi:hypothetical protein